MVCISAKERLQYTAHGDCYFVLWTPCQWEKQLGKDFGGPFSTMQEVNRRSLGV